MNAMVLNVVEAAASPGVWVCATVAVSRAASPRAWHSAASEAPGTTKTCPNNCIYRDLHLFCMVAALRLTLLPFGILVASATCLAGSTVVVDAASFGRATMNGMFQFKAEREP